MLAESPVEIEYEAESDIVYLLVVKATADNTDFKGTIQTGGQSNIGTIIVTVFIVLVLLSIICCVILGVVGYFIWKKNKEEAYQE